MCSTVDLHEGITVFAVGNILKFFQQKNNYFSVGNKFKGFGVYSGGLWPVMRQSKFTFLPLQIDLFYIGNKDSYSY